MDRLQQASGLSDKVSLGYYPVYEELASHVPEPGAVLEIGVARGGSLLMWQHLLPKAVIVGVDNNSEGAAQWPEGTVQVVADQAYPGLPGLVTSYAPEGYDLIAEDGCHFAEASAASFRLLWPLVKPGGWYVLEDWAVGLASSHYYPSHGGDAMLRFAQSLVERIEPSKPLRDMGGLNIPAGVPGAVEEVRYRYGLACVRKNSL